MKIHEYQARDLFEEYGIPISPAVTADTAEEAVRGAKKIGLPVVIKAQVLVGGRGKAGGVKLAKTEKEAEKAAREILELTIKDLPVSKVLVAQAEDISKEYYLGLTVDRAKKRITLMLSAEGGVEIEELAEKAPEKILRLWADPENGFEEDELRKTLENAFPNQSQADEAKKTVERLYKLFLEKGCSLVEINPYAEVGDGKLLALDAKINFDDNEVPYHPEIGAYRNLEEYSENELKAGKAGLNFISLDGSIGCVVNGAGLAMATMDIIKLYGSKPANFLDVGGSSSPEKVLAALKVIMNIPGVTGILFNIFGGITRCDDIAKGILLAKEQIDIPIPIVIRLIGTNDEEGRKMLKEADISAMENLDEAVKEIIRQTGGSR